MGKLKLTFRAKVMNDLQKQEMGERIAQRMKELKLTDVAVAEFVGISKVSVGKWRKGDSEPTGRNLTKLVEILETSPEYITMGEKRISTQIQTQNGQFQSQTYSQKNTPSKKARYVPIRGKAQMGADGFWLEYDYPPGFGDGYVIVENASDKAYAVEGAGMSMYPAIRSGWIVVFEPEKPLCSGEFVHIGLSDGQRMIKELISYQNGVLNVLSVNGNERLVFDESEIEFINASKSIYPPSAVIHDLPEAVESPAIEYNP